MKKRILIGFLFILSLSIMAMTQKRTEKYDKEWKSVETFEKDGLPESASKEAGKILKKAVAEKDNQQVIKALIHINKYKIYVDNDDKDGLIPDLQKLASETKDVSERSLLHSMIAELYYGYYSGNRWQIRALTPIDGDAPADMKEWPSNVFLNKIMENLYLSVNDVKELEKHSIEQFTDLIIEGKNVKEYYPTLYDFLMLRAMRISGQLSNEDGRVSDIETATGLTIDQLSLPAQEFVKLDIKNARYTKSLPYYYYQQYLSYQLSKGQNTALMFSEVGKLALLRTTTNKFGTDKQISALKNLLETYKNYEVSSEIAAALANAMLGVADTDEKKAEVFAFVNEQLSKYPNYARIHALQGVMGGIQKPYITIETDRLFYPNKEVKAKIVHKNIQSLGNSSGFALFQEVDGKDVHIKDYTPSIVSKTVYANDTLQLDLGAFDVGKYKLAFIQNLSTFDSMDNKLTTAKEKNNVSEFIVSRMTSYSRNSKKDQYEIFVVDRITGQPLSGVKVDVKQNKYDSNQEQKEITTTLTTNKLGLVTFEDKLSDETNRYRYERANYSIAIGADSLMTPAPLYNGSHNYVQMEVEESTDAQFINVFTDRSIYRPGQPVFFKGMVSDKDNKMLANKKHTVTLLNDRHEIVAKKEVVANEFGSVSGDFVLPQSGTLGYYHIEIGTGSSVYFQVAEYKRPTFEITFDKVEGTYSFGEEVTLRGNVKTFSGVPLQDMEVEYNIDRRDAFPFMFYSIGAAHFDSGTTKTDADGKFSITFVPKDADQKAISFRPNSSNIFSFDVSTTVTDMSGETQSNNYSIAVGDVSMAINTEMPMQVEKSDSTKIKINTLNLQGQEIKTKGSYKLVKLNDKDEAVSTTLTGDFETGDQAVLREKLKAVESGKYRLEIKALDDKGKEVSGQNDFVLFSYNDKKPPIKTNVWLVDKNLTFSKKKPAEIIFGSSEKDSYVLYEVFNNDKVFERKFIKFSDENRTFKIDYKDVYGDNVCVAFTLVKDGKFESNNMLLSKELEIEDTSLNIKLEVFRDKLRTGQSETWTISVKNKDGQAASAELLATMYDASLDKINPYTPWYINRSHKPGKSIFLADYSYASYYSGSYAKYLTLDQAQKMIEGKEIVFDQLNWFDYPMGGYQISDMHVRRMYKTQSPAPVMAGAGIASEAEFSEDAVLAESKVQAMGDATANKATAAPQIRQNLSETAFFFPQLRTNEKGETLVSFTAPESNTTWRFRVLAHDKNLRVGEVEKMVVTNKELMVTPNMPRFIREGDKTSISTKISNLSEGDIAGDVRIEFFDPITDKVIDLGIKDAKQAFSMKQGGTESAIWTFDVPADIQLIGCRIVAESASFSDGEQHALAVLPNRMLVTESMPFDVTKAGESVFTFDKLANNKSNTLSNYKLTIEYANNPAWYAVLALPTMSNPTNENAVSWFASYYVNSLGASISKQHPKVTAMIKAWKQQGGTKETLVSKLGKNDELKSILLEETPWVLDAKNESEQMERLSLLFDLNNTQELTRTAIEKLGELQTPAGGWSWYKGMGESRSVTQYIMYGLSELVTTGQIEYPQSVKEMQMRALRYMDAEIVKDFANLKKYNKDWEKITSISTSQLEYMYVRSSYRDVNPSHETREAERFYTSVVSKNWTKLSLYQKSLLAMLAKRNGDKELATKLSKSIKEYAKVSDVQGMYWPNNKGNAFLSMSNISTHTFLMKALLENGASDSEMDTMKKWLVKQKQTQIWESTHATIDAINILLSTGSDWFSGETAAATVKVGNKLVDTKNSELGTGYIKSSWDAGEISTDMAKVSVTNSNTTASYGAMYWQYYENLDKISAQGGDMNISKELYKKVKSDKGETLVAITNSNPITVGDQIVVRLTVRANTNLEFVHLKDMRASCFEPLSSLSGMQWNGGLSYYQTVKDASTNYFFDYLPKGTYVLEYPVYANRSGEYANGITSLQCLYTPEYVSHTTGLKVVVKEKK